MDKITVNCRNFRCVNNDKGKCKLEKIILQAVDAPENIGLLICADAEEPETETA